MTTVINGNGWYLFGIADGQKIAKLVKSGENNTNNFLNAHIVKNHSANVETAYIVEKHNPVTAWITKSGTTYTANTNMSGTTKYYQWFDNADVNIQDQTDVESSHEDAYKVVITNHQTAPTEKVIATYADVVIIGIEKNDTETEPTQATQATQASWAFEPNTVLEAIVNKSGTHSYQWQITDDIGTTNVSNPPNDADGNPETNKFIVTGPNIGKTISVTVTTDSNAVTATYDTSIGASVSPFESRNWKKIIYAAPTLNAINTTNDEYYNGVSEWTNSTGITLGIWVKITGFADTVPPKLAGESSDDQKTRSKVEDGKTVPLQSSANTLQKQTITIPFTKNLVLDSNPGPNLSDFSIRITDNRENDDTQKKTCDPSLFPKQNSARIIHPESVTVSGKNLILTLPHFVPVADGGNKPQVYNATNGSGLSDATDTIEVQYQRSLNANPPTMLTDDSLYPNPGVGNYYGTNASRNYGNLVPDFGYDVIDTASITGTDTVYSVGHDIDWTGELTNNVSQDNTAPTVTNIVVNSNGKDIVLTFSENIAGTNNTTTYTGFSVTYTDGRSAFQKNPSRGGVINNGVSFVASGDWGTDAGQLQSEGGGNSITEWTDAYFTAKKTAANKITITLSDDIDVVSDKYTSETSNKRRIFKHHSDAPHTVTVSYSGTSDPALTQYVNNSSGAFYANKVQAFTNFSATNSSSLNDTYPTISKGAFVSGITTETNKGTEITNNFTVQGPSGKTGLEWTLVECDVNGIAVTADTKNGAVTNNFELTTTTANNTRLRLNHRPNFSYTDANTRAGAAGDSGGGWKTESNGIQSNVTYHFRLVATIKGDRDGDGSNDDDFITYSPILSYNNSHGSDATTSGNHITYTDVKTQLTRKLIAANQVIKESKMVIFFDNESGELAIGPTNDLEDTKSNTIPKARNNYANGFISITLGFGNSGDDWTSTNGSHFLGESLSKQGTTWTNSQKTKNVTAGQTEDMALFYAENGDAATTGQDGATTNAGFAYGSTREESLASAEALGARMTDNFKAASGGAFGSYFLKGQGKYTEKNNNSGNATSLKQYAANAHQRIFQNTGEGWATDPYFNVGTLLSKNLAWIWNSASGVMFNPTVKDTNDKGTYAGKLNSNIGWYEDEDDNYFMQLNYSRFGHFKLKSNLIPAGHGVKNTFLGIDTQMKNTDTSAVAEPFNPTKTTTHDYVTVTHTLS